MVTGWFMVRYYPELACTVFYFGGGDSAGKCAKGGGRYADERGPGGEGDVAGSGGQGGPGDLPW